MKRSQKQKQPTQQQKHTYINNKIITPNMKKNTTTTNKTKQTKQTTNKNIRTKNETLNTHKKR